MNTTISAMIEHAQPGITYTTTATIDEIHDAWQYNERKDHYSIVVEGDFDHNFYEFRLVPKEPAACNSDKYTDNALIVVIALLGLCMVGYVALGLHLS